jgi:hypothetical protein
MRAEDLVLAALALVCVLHWRRAGPITAPTVAIVGVVCASLVSTGVAVARGTVDPLTAVLYAVRPVEYWIAFPAALLLLRSTDRRWPTRFEGLLVVVTVLQTAFAVAQYYFMVPIGFSHAAYSRAAGLTVGPYELGAISAALAVYWIARGRWTMASLATVALAASISRVSILGAGLAIAILAGAWLVRLGKRISATGWRGAIGRGSKPRLLIVGQVLSVAAAGAVLAFTIGVVHLPSAPTAAVPTTQAEDSPAPVTPTPTAASPSPANTPSPSEAAPTGPQAPSDSITKRIASTSLLGSWTAAGALAAKVPHAETSDEYRTAAFTDLNSYVNVNAAAAAGLDASNLVRFFRWHLILNTFDDAPDVLFGLGPSFVGPSVDGSYLRMFAEGGVLGVLAWLALIVAWLRRTPLWMVCVTISLLVGALFIDIVYAERPMVLFWALLALAVVRRRPLPAPRTADIEESSPPRRRHAER